MKTIRNILFSFIILGLTLPENVWSFANQLPDWFNHINEHRAERDYVSVFDFFSGHLGAAENQHSNNHSHGKLPPDHHPSSDFNQSITCIPFFAKEDYNIILLSSASMKISYNQFFMPSEFFQTIWQPPKILLF